MRIKYVIKIKYIYNLNKL